MFFHPFGDVAREIIVGNQCLLNVMPFLVWTLDNSCFACSNLKSSSCHIKKSFSLDPMTIKSTRQSIERNRFQCAMLLCIVMSPICSNFRLIVHWWCALHELVMSEKWCTWALLIELSLFILADADARRRLSILCSILIGSYAIHWQPNGKRLRKWSAKSNRTSKTHGNSIAFIFPRRKFIPPIFFIISSVMPIAWCHSMSS